MPSRTVPSSDDCDGDDRGQIHVAGVLHVSVDFELLPFKLSQLVDYELGERHRRSFVHSRFPANVRRSHTHNAEVDGVISYF